MRRIIVGLLAGGLAVGACSGANQPPAANQLVPANPNAAAPANSTAAPAKPTTTGGAPDVSAAARTATVREITVPAGTSLPIVLDTTVGSDVSRVEEAVQAHLSRSVVVNGVAVLPEGSRVSGVVTDATRSGKVKGRAHVAMRFTTLVPRGEEERYQIRTAAISRMAPATKKKDALEIGAPAAGGAIIGGILGGKKGAAIGGAAGGGAGTAVVLSTRGKEVHVPKGTALTLKLSEPITVRVRG
jgi:hypothetical protein